QRLKSLIHSAACINRQYTQKVVMVHKSDEPTPRPCRPRHIRRDSVCKRKADALENPSRKRSELCASYQLLRNNAMSRSVSCVRTLPNNKVPSYQRLERI